MTLEERLAICREAAILSMWGHGWVGRSLTERLDQVFPDTPSWSELYRTNEREWVRDHVGEVADETTLQNYLRRGFWLVNFDEYGCSLFNPPPMNGLCKYVSKKLADKHTPQSGWS